MDDLLELPIFKIVSKVVTSISERYIELYENIVGEKFKKEDVSKVVDRVEKNIKTFLQ